MDFATSFGSEAAFVASYLLTFRLVAQVHGPAAFAEYSLARRALALLLPLLSLGMDVALARHIAYAIGQRRAGRQSAYVVAGLTVSLVACVVVGGGLAVFSSPAAAVLLGAGSLNGLVLGVVVAAAGAALHAVAYGTLRGQMRIQRANVLMVTAHGICPPLAAVLVPGAVSNMLVALGIVWAGVSVAFILTAISEVPASPASVAARGVELLGYSVPRVPGDLVQLALFALPGVLAVRLAGVEAGGHVAFAIVALGMVGSAVFPINFVLLPFAARTFGRGGASDLMDQVAGIARTGGVVLVLGTGVFEVLARPLVNLYLGPSYAGAVPMLQVVMLGAIPWGAFMSFKGIVDARTRRPINALNCGIAFVVFLVVGGVAFASGSVIGIVVSFVVSLYVLGILTAREVWKSMQGDRLSEAAATPPVTDPS